MKTCDLAFYRFLEIVRLFVNMNACHGVGVGCEKGGAFVAFVSLASARDLLRGALALTASEQASERSARSAFSLCGRRAAR